MKRLRLLARDRIVRVRFTPAGLTHEGTVAVDRKWSCLISSTVLHPFARPALPGVDARTGALTPAWLALRTARFLARNSARQHHPVCLAGLPASRVWPSEHSVPNHLTAPAVALTHNPSARQAFWASPLSSRLAGRPGRNGFVSLRTARLPPVALHPLSQGRSYFRLQAGVCMPDEDFHLADQTRSQAH